MCRLTIMVPYDRDEAAFETSLVSVLENRPEHCEVIVAHDGRYTDPFDLEDEVRFVVAEAGSYIDLLRVATKVSMGRVVHILASGVRATECWTEEPVNMFEQSDLGCVAPIIREISADSPIVAAGWRDTKCRLRQPIASGATTPDRREVAAIQGAYLQASFWRRSVLDSLLDLSLDSSLGAADYVFAYAMRKAGWRCRLSPESSVVACRTCVASSLGACQETAAMQAFRSALGKEGGFAAAALGLLGLLANPFHPAGWSECWGRSAGVLGTNRFSEMLDYSTELVREIDQVSSSIGPDAAVKRIYSHPASESAAFSRRRAA